jgi:hypothetical protein
MNKIIRRAARLRVDSGPMFTGAQAARSGVHPPASPSPRADALEVFIARAEARALLWQAGELDLHQAVDELQAAAIASGLVAELGQDEVQRLMAEAFAAVRGDLGADEKGSAEPFVPADDEYEGLSSTFAALCRAADEKQRRKPPDPRLERLRQPMADDVSLERAYAEVSKPAGVAESTLQAAEFLIQQNDPQRLRAWLAKHSGAERQAISLYLRNREANYHGKVGSGCL